MATMADVAKHARVSKMTVSRVLNGTGYVKEETRQRIEQAIEALDYHPNLLAKALVTGKTNLIAYVLPDIGDPFFANTSRGVMNTCNSRGYTAVVYNADKKGSVEDFTQMAIDRKLDGVIFHHLNIGQSTIDRLLENGIETALIDNECALINTNNIVNSDYRGGAMAVRYLFEKGYRKIACVEGRYPDGMAQPEGMTYPESFQRQIWRARTAGFRDTMQAVGLEPFAAYYGSGSAPMNVCFARGQAIARQILAGSEFPDAVYCESDLIALGILSELLEAGIDIPGRISLIGHDGLDMCRCLFPRITTIVMPQYAAGQAAAACLLRCISGKSGYQNLELEPTIFCGDTTRG